MTLSAHFDGKVIVLDEPLPLPLRSGTRLRVSVEAIGDTGPATPVSRRFEPLKIQIDPALSNAIALDPEFNVEEAR
jgi:hypothetical protein